MSFMRVGALPCLLAAMFTCPAAAATGDLAGAPLARPGPRSLALGGASRGDPLDLDNIQRTPAVLALEPMYDLWADATLEAGDSRGLKVSAADSRTGAVTLGVAWRWNRNADLPLEPEELPGWAPEGGLTDNEADTWAIDAGLALANRNRTVSVGLQAQRWWREAAVAGDGDGWRVGLSGAARPSDAVTFSVGGSVPILAQNPRDTEDSFWLEAGTQVRPADDFSLLLDLVMPVPDMGLPAISAGAQWAAGGAVPLRLGWYTPSGGGFHAVSGGVGLKSSNVSLEYGLRIPIAMEEGVEEGVIHGLGVHLAF